MRVPSARTASNEEPERLLGSDNSLTLHLVTRSRISAQVETGESRFERDGQLLESLIRGLVEFDLTPDDILRQIPGDGSDE